MYVLSELLVSHVWFNCTFLNVDFSPLCPFKGILKLQPKGCIVTLVTLVVSECAFTFPRKWKSFVPFLQKYGDCGRSITNVMNSWRLATLSGNLGRLVIYPTPLDFHRDIWWCFNLKVVSIHFEHFIIDYLSFISSQGNLY